MSGSCAGLEGSASSDKSSRSASLEDDRYFGPNDRWLTGSNTRLFDGKPRIYERVVKLLQRWAIANNFGYNVLYS